VDSAKVVVYLVMYAVLFSKYVVMHGVMPESAGEVPDLHGSP